MTLVRPTHLVNLLKAKGSDDPINDAAAMLDALPEFVAAHYERFNKHSQECSKRVRDREIVRLARTKTNQEIADRYDLSKRQVMRIIKAADLGQYSRD